MKKKTEEQPAKGYEAVLPVIPLRGLILFPDMTLHFDIGRKTSLSAVKAAGENGTELFFVAQKDADTDDPGADDLIQTGVIGSIRQIVRLPDRTGAIRVVAEGRMRGRIADICERKPHMTARVGGIPDDRTLPEGAAGPEELYTAAALFSARRIFAEYCEHAESVTPDIVQSVYKTEDPGRLSDVIGGNVVFDFNDRARLLSEFNVYRRLELLCVVLARETRILIIDAQLQEKVNERMDKNQREYYLREELKAINEELGETEGDDAAALETQIVRSGMPDALKEKLFVELDRMRRLSPASPDSYVLRTYIEKCLELPWGVYTKENKNLTRARRILERDHYGLREVKDRVTEMLAALIVSPELKGQIICLAGPPGVGKTSIAKSVAAATNRKYARVSLGGVRDEAEIRGHRRTYIGAIPGRVISALTEAKSMNPLILLDEVDKLGGDVKGDPASALLEVLDAEQNYAFRDHYIDLPVDLSRVLFITTANDKYAIPDALRDRMEIIDLPGYTFEEKFHIAKKHLLPKQMKAHGLDKTRLRVSDAALRAIIGGYTKEAGVRVLERKLAAICRKETVRLAEGETARLDVTERELEPLLGPAKYRPGEDTHPDSVGLVNGLAWTAVGGELLPAEVAVLPGSGKLELTGSLGDVMKESARAAISFIRASAERYGIDPDFYKTKDIHIHFPEGAVPKDGPSAGVTTVTAVVSALTGRKVRGDVAMTGEITLRGRVLPIGGLREKSMAAYREEMRVVVIPRGNVPDLAEVDDAVKAKLTFIPAQTVEDVLAVALLPSEDAAPEDTEKSAPPQPERKRPPRDYGAERGRTGEYQ